MEQYERMVQMVSRGKARIRGDCAMLQRALGNLLSNAIHHTLRGRTVRARLSRAEDGRVSIEVENPGAEIPAEHLPRLFHPFYRLDPSRQRSDAGTGLGLAIVKSIVDAHGGKIEVSSAGGHTVFRLDGPPTRRPLPNPRLA